jgi:hypothetical protein
MPARIAADAVLLLHLTFIVFVMLGGLLVLRWRSLMLLHLPAIAWAAFVELSGTICPLTFIENQLRAAAGLSGYAGDFVEHYLLRTIYPDGLTHATQLLLALAVLVVNLAIYGAVWLSGRERLVDERR